MRVFITAIQFDYSTIAGQITELAFLIPEVTCCIFCNGEIPSVDEATLDHQRLLDRLQLYELVEFKVHGDGNCQFHALSDRFCHSPEHHKFARQQIVNQLKSCPEIYEGYVPMAYGDYLKKEW
ncbi:unnamed protein product [Camellia sinensis]